MAVTRSPRPVQGCLSFTSAPQREPATERGEMRRETLVLETRAASPLRQEPVAPQPRRSTRQSTQQSTQNAAPRAARSRKPRASSGPAVQAAPTLVVLGRWNEEQPRPVPSTRIAAGRPALGSLVFEALGTVLAVGSMLLAAAYL